MRILANILRTFKVSSRESCRITNRRYSSQICPRVRGSLSSPHSSAMNVVCMRTFTKTPLDCNKSNGTADTLNSSSGNSISNLQIVPVALLKTQSEIDENSVKVLVIPINLFNNDKEAVQKTMSTMSVLRENAEKIDAFTVNAAAFATKQSSKNSNVFETSKRRIEEPLWQDFDIGPEGAFKDGLDEVAVSGLKGGRMTAANPLDAFDWNDGKGYIVADVPPSLEQRFADAGIASMDLAFEIDMTNIKDAMLMRDRLVNDLEDYQDPITMSLRDPMISMTASVETDLLNISSTVPLSFNALIQGTVNIDSSKLSAEDIEVPQFNDYVTSMAANICSTALQKGFPADLSRMYSTQTPTEGLKKSRSPHIVCERQGDKGCVSPGNSELDPYVPKGKKTDDNVHSKAEQSESDASKTQQQSLLTSTIIGDSGARGLMSCKAYAIALKEAQRLREVFAAAKKCRSDAAKVQKECADDRNNPCAGTKDKKPECPQLPCGPPKKDSICKDKVLRDPPEKEPTNDPCRPQDSPCQRASSEASKGSVELKQLCSEAKPAPVLKPCAAAKPANVEGMECPHKPKEIQKPSVEMKNAPVMKGPEPPNLAKKAEAPKPTAEKQCEAKTGPQPSAQKQCEAKTAPQPSAQKQCEAKTAPQPSAQKQCEAKIASQPKAQKQCEAKIASQPKAEKQCEVKTAPQPTAGKQCEAKTAPQLTVEIKCEAKTAPQDTVEKKFEAKTAPQPKTEKKAEVKAAAEPKAERKCESKPVLSAKLPEQPKALEKGFALKTEQKAEVKSAKAATAMKSAVAKSSEPKVQQSNAASEAKTLQKQCVEPKFMGAAKSSDAEIPEASCAASPFEPNTDEKTASVLFSDDKKPCNSIPFKCPVPEPKKRIEQTWDNDPCRQNYPKKCPPKTSVGGCKRPIVDPCAPSGGCGEEKKEKKEEKPCKKDPCTEKGGKKAAAVTPSEIANTAQPTLLLKPQEHFTFQACEAFKKACSKRTAPKNCEAPAGGNMKYLSGDVPHPAELLKPTIVIASDILPREAKCPKDFAGKIIESAGNNMPGAHVTVNLCQMKIGQFSKTENTNKSERLTLKSVSCSSGSTPTNPSQQSNCSPPKTDKKSSSSPSGTRCPNTDSIAPRSTKPNCPRRESGQTDNKTVRCFSTLLSRRLFTAASSKNTGIPLAGTTFMTPVSFYSKKENDKDTVQIDCPPGPPKPRKRIDIKAEPGLKDCFAQERLDEPCQAIKPPEKSSCNEQPESRGCLDDFDENKLCKCSSTLLLNPRLPMLNAANQIRSFSSSSALAQHEKYKLEEHEENEDSPNQRPKITRIRKALETRGIENEIVRIGAAGEVLKVVEPIQEVTDYDILVRVSAIALSGSDIHVYETGGDKCTGITIGHDAAGIVEKVGKCVDKLKPGDCVAMESGLCCGICDVCKQGNYNLCPQLFHNGFFSTHQTHPADLCHKIPDNVTMEDATLTSILALGLQACFKAEITPTTNVLVIGTSPKACAAALCARALGAKSVAVMAHNVYTLESIRILFDFDYVHYYENETNLMEKITERVVTVLKDRPNVVINYAISETSMTMAVGLLKPGGKCVLAECDNEYASFNAMDVLMKSISLITSFRSANMFPAALNLIKSGKTPIGELVSRIYTWDQIKWAFHWAQYEANMGNRKVIVQGPDSL